MELMLLLAFVIIVAILSDKRPARPLTRGQRWRVAAVILTAAGLGAIIALGQYVR